MIESCKHSWINDDSLEFEMKTRTNSYLKPRENRPQLHELSLDSSRKHKVEQLKTYLMFRS